MNQYRASFDWKYGGSEVGIWNVVAVAVVDWEIVPKWSAGEVIWTHYLGLLFKIYQDPWIRAAAFFREKETF